MNFRDGSCLSIRNDWIIERNWLQTYTRSVSVKDSRRWPKGLSLNEFHINKYFCAITTPPYTSETRIPPLMCLPTAHGHWASEMVMVLSYLTRRCRDPKTIHGGRYKLTDFSAQAHTSAGEGNLAGFPFTTCLKKPDSLSIISLFRP